MSFKETRTYGKFSNRIGNVRNAKFRIEIASTRIGKDAFTFNGRIDDASIGMSEEYTDDNERESI